MKFDIGINSNNGCGENINEILMNVASVGIENVMIAYKTGKIEETLKIANSLNLKVPFVHLCTTGNLWVDNGAACQIEFLKKQLELTAKYNIPIAIFHATTGAKDEVKLKPNLTGLKRICEIVDYAEKLGVKMAMENLDEFSFRQFEFVMKNITSSNLGFCYDVGHHQLILPQIDLLSRYGDRLMAVHLHDNFMNYSTGNCWDKDLHMLPFDGVINFKEVMHKLAKCNYDNVVLLEVHKVKRNSNFYDNKTNLEFLKEAKSRACELANLLAEAKSFYEIEK